VTQVRVLEAVCSASGLPEGLALTRNSLRYLTKVSGCKEANLPIAFTSYLQGTFNPSSSGDPSTQVRVLEVVCSASGIPEGLAFAMSVGGDCHKKPITSLAFSCANIYIYIHIHTCAYIYIYIYIYI